MRSKSQIYPNIYNFLINNDFKIIETKEGLISFEFETSEIVSAFSRFEELQLKGDKEINDEIADNYYSQSWQIRTEIEKKYYPKFETIFAALDLFYKNRNTDLEFLLFLDNNSLEEISLGYNDLYYKASLEKQLFIKKSHQELLDFDKFIENY